MRKDKFVHKHKEGGGNGSGFLRFLLLAIVGAVIGFFVWGIQSSGVKKFDRYNVVILGKQIALVSLDTVKEQASIIYLPADLYISNVAYGYGQYTISKVYEVGQLDLKGGIVIKDTVSDFFGVPISGFVKLGEKDNIEIKNIFKAVKFVFSAKKTDMSFFDRVVFAWRMARMRYDRAKVIDLEKVSSKLLLADGSSGLTIEKEYLDNFLAGDFLEERVRDERLRIQVINSTQYAGLGSRGARILENIGMSVVGVDSTDYPVEKCQLRFDKKFKDSLTVSRIASIFDCEFETPLENTKGDIVLVLGKGYSKKLFSGQ